MLAYALDQAPMEEKIVRECAHRRIGLPPKIAGAPELHLGLELYWTAYSELSTCRPSSFGGIMPIPWTSILEYSAMNEFDQEQREDLIRFTRAMDAEFTRWYERTHSKNG